MPNPTLKNASLAIDLDGDLALEHVEPFIFLGMAVERRSS
jgi:hypothetical protein